MAERIFELTGAVAVKLVHERLTLLCASGQGLFEKRVYVLDIEMDADRRAAQCFWRLAAILRKFICHHNYGIAQTDFGVAESSIRHQQFVDLVRSERLF